MIVSFSKDVFEDTRILPTLNTDFLREFIRIAIENIKSGTTAKSKYAKAADSLSVEVSVIERSIEALSEVYIECSRRNITESDFSTSIQELLFNPEQNKALSQVYSSNVKEIRSFLSDLSMRLPHYHNLDWRLDIQVSSRCLRNQVKPVFVLELETHSSAGPAAGNTNTTASTSTPSSIPSSLSSDSSSSSVSQLQSDYANLQHMLEEVERAVNQFHTKHSRRMIRYIK